MPLEIETASGPGFYCQFLYEETQMATVTLKGNPVTVAGNLPRKGEVVSDFRLTGKDLGDVSLKNYAGKRKVLNIVPSLDTPTCQQSTRVFNQKASSANNSIVLVISADLPFAMARVRSKDFHVKYGVDIADGPLKGLTARAVVVLDENNKVLHSELVPEIASEPNYDAALEALK